MTIERTTSTQISFPEKVYDSMCRNPSVVQIHSFISYVGSWFQTIPQLKNLYVEVLG
jgi:hypothetical protein